VVAAPADVPSSVAPRSLSPWESSRGKEAIKRHAQNRIHTHAMLWDPENAPSAEQYRPGSRMEEIAADLGETGDDSTRRRKKGRICTLAVSVTSGKPGNKLHVDYMRENNFPG
jgi:hypothetical protein